MFELVSCACHDLSFNKYIYKYKVTIVDRNKFNVVQNETQKEEGAHALFILEVGGGGLNAENCQIIDVFKLLTKRLYGVTVALSWKTPHLVCCGMTFIKHRANIIIYIYCAKSIISM